jgi:hypothetical protein
MTGESDSPDLHWMHDSYEGTRESASRFHGPYHDPGVTIKLHLARGKGQLLTPGLWRKEVGIPRVPRPLWSLALDHLD